jgi:hypothetical protein
MRILAARSASFDVPVDPDAPEARDWLLEELSKAEYQAAKPSWFDLLMQSIWDWINSIEFGGFSGPPAFGLLVVGIIVVAALVVAFLIFGLPRINRRSKVAGVLFGEDDDRDAAAMRSAAERAAAAGDYSAAIAEMFRAIARGMAERTIVSTTPGTTAQDFSLRAGAAFPAFAAELRTAAGSFDEVRYLGGVGTADDFERLSALERALRSARPVLELAPA